MVFLEYFMFLLVGVLMGLIGAGGSTFILPILIFFLKIDSILASTYTLFVVMVSSFFSLIIKHTFKSIHIKILLYFAIPSFVVIFFVRKFILHYLPDVFFRFGNIEIKKTNLFLIFFSIILIYFSKLLISKKESIFKFSKKKYIITGFKVGVLTGFFGIGGGFMYIPIFLKKFKMDFNEAVINSLFLIFISAIFSLSVDVAFSQQKINFLYILPFAIFSSIGSYFGAYFRKFINHFKMQLFFSKLILIFGIYILLNQLYTIFY